MASPRKALRQAASKTKGGLFTSLLLIAQAGLPPRHFPHMSQASSQALHLFLRSLKLSLRVFVIHFHALCALRPFPANLGLPDSLFELRRSGVFKCLALCHKLYLNLLYTVIHFVSLL
jgi:hypothetical protein